MSADYLMLQRRAQYRLRSAEIRLSLLYRQWQDGLAQCRQSEGEIALLRQLDDLEVSAGGTFSRGQLFSCLRKTAITRQRYQALCLQLQLQQERTSQHEQAWQVQLDRCQMLRARLENRTQLSRRHRRQRDARRLDSEEAELEERKAWNR